MAVRKFLRPALEAAAAKLEAVMAERLRRWLDDLPRPPVITQPRRYEDGTTVGRCPSCGVQWSDEPEAHRHG